MRAGQPLGSVILLSAVLLLAVGAVAQEQDVPAAPSAEPEQAARQITISEATPGTAVLHAAYYFQLTAEGATPPLRWKLVKGELPPSVELDSITGVIAGQPAELGDFTFTVEVRDASQPPLTAQREFTIHVAAALAVTWKTSPMVEGDKISGAVKLSNSTSDDFDFTLIVVAVNEYGKAFALGYQHFTLNRETTGLDIDFASNVPAGQYIVHVDAVAEVPQRDAIFRSRLQTPEALVVPLIQ